MKGMYQSLLSGFPREYDPDCETSPYDCIYCQNIQALVDLKATFITRANQYWGSDVGLFKPEYSENWPQSEYWNSLQMLVRDINKAFDCAGLRRPIIQGGIWETMYPNVCQVPIPACVIDHFKTNYPNEFTSEDLQYYQPGISFNYKNICFEEDWFEDCAGECSANSWEAPSGTTCDACDPDISKLETKMWYYYVGKNLIDRGFKSIWIGQQYVISSESEQEDGYPSLTTVLSDIREYAEDQGTFVVIQGEGGNEYDPNGNLLFDFANSAPRPREIYTYPNGNPINVGSNNDRQTSWDGCSGSGNYDASMFSGTPCSDIYEPFMAFLDPCHNTDTAIYAPFTGTTPLGCDVSYSPLTLVWDNSFGCIESNTYGFPAKPTGEYYLLTTPAKPRTAAAAVWGWDESNWWIDGFQGGVGDNGDQCRATWLAQAMETVRSTFPNPNTFLHMPGIVWYACCSSTCDPENPPIKTFIIGAPEHEGFKDEMAELWTPIPITQNSIGLKVNCVNDPQYSCSTVNLCGTYITENKRSEYTFYVKNPDVTSVYSWHIWDLANQEWLPFNYGRERKLIVESDKQYEVFLRQDNLGLENNVFGKIQVSKTFSLSRDCCISEFETPVGEFQVNISTPAECLRRISIIGANASNVDRFYWNITGGSIIQYYTSNRSSILVAVKENSINFSYCGVYYSEQKLYEGDGNILIPEDCDDRIEIFPNPVSTNHSLINVAIVDEYLLNEVTNTGQPIDFTVLRNIDGTIVKSFQAIQAVTEVNIDGLESGTYTVHSNYNGEIITANFIVIE